MIMQMNMTQKKISLMEKRIDKKVVEQMFWSEWNIQNEFMNLMNFKKDRQTKYV